MKSLFLILLLLMAVTPAYAMGIVNVEAKAVAGLSGTKIEAIRVYRVSNGGRLSPIPFQIDEKVGTFTNTIRPWAMDQGVAKLAPNKILEEDELLLWALQDGGEKLNIQNSSSEFSQLWEVAIDAERGPYFYLAVTDPAALQAKRSYLQYDKAQDKIKAPGYEIAFNKKYPLVQEVLKITNGSIPYDILDRFKARFFLDIKNFFNFKFDEQGIKARVIGTRSGPIRVIRLVQASKSLGPIKVIPKSNIDFYFYPYWLTVPTKINNPMDGSKTLNSETQGLSGFDFNNYVLGSDLRTNLGSVVLRLDGKNSGELEKISGENLRWWSLTGVSGSMVQSIRNDPQLRGLGIHPYLILINDSTRKSPPESEIGEVFVGFDLPYNKIPKGNYAIEVKQVFPKEYISGNETTYLQEAILLQPRQVEKIK